MERETACFDGAPFAGLGFDLSPVLRAAMGMSLARTDNMTRPTTVVAEYPVPVWGYGLMLALARETLGS